MENKERKKAITRSPSYPMISLEEAIKRVKLIWEKDGNNKIPQEVAIQHLGYKQKTSYSSRIIAALKKFGLINEEQNDIILTKNAVDLAICEQTDQQYIKSLKETALKPAIYEKLYSEYKGKVPSTATLKHKLITGYRVNPKSVDDLIDNFASTINYAGLGENLEEAYTKQEEKTQESHTEKIKTEKPTESRTNLGFGIDILHSFDIPLTENYATISFKKMPITEEDLEDVKKWIDFFGKKLIKKKDIPLDSIWN